MAKRILTNSRYDEMPHLRELYSICIVLPLTSTECERGFSKVNGIKRKDRSRLGNKTLENLIFMSLYGGKAKGIRKAHYPPDIKACAKDLASTWKHIKS